MDLVKTGIEGFDSMIQGGIPQGHSVLVAGGPGTGKTSFAMEFLYRGALNGERGIYITTEEEPENIIRNINSVFKGWKKFDELVKSKTINIVKTTRIDIPSVASIVRSEVVGKKAARLIIDSTTMLKLFYKTPVEFRKGLFSLLMNLSKVNCTTLIIGELKTIERAGLTFGVEEFLVDGIVNLYNMEMKNTRTNALEVLKMRAVDHKKNVVPMKITENGIKVFAAEKIF